MSFSSFVREANRRPRVLRVYAGDGSSGGIVDRLDAFFSGDVVTVKEQSRPDIVANFVAFPDREDAVAVTTLDDPGHVLLIDPRFRVLGRESIDDVPNPEVVARLDESTFGVQRGSKSLLVRIAKYIERLALRAETGRLYAGFQTLEQFESDAETRERYGRLARAGVDVHVFGAADTTPSDRSAVDDEDGILHARDAAEIRGTWFVVFDGGGEGAALVAEERNPGNYVGFWTFDSNRISELLAYVSETYLEDA